MFLFRAARIAKIFLISNAFANFRTKEMMSRKLRSERTWLKRFFPVRPYRIIIRWDRGTWAGVSWSNRRVALNIQGAAVCFGELPQSLVPVPSDYKRNHYVCLHLSGLRLTIAERLHLMYRSDVRFDNDCEHPTSVFAYVHLERTFDSVHIVQIYCTELVHDACDPAELREDFHVYIAVTTKFSNRNSSALGIIITHNWCLQVDSLSTAIGKNWRGRLGVIGQCYFWLSWCVFRYTVDHFCVCEP